MNWERSIGYHAGLSASVTYRCNVMLLPIQAKEKSLRCAGGCVRCCTAYCSASVEPHSFVSYLLEAGIFVGAWLTQLERNIKMSVY